MTAIKRIDANIEFDLMDYILVKENHAVNGFASVDDGAYTLNKCPICGAMEPHFKLYDRGKFGSDGFMWESSCTGGKKKKSVEFVEKYRHYGDWFSANNYCKEQIKKERNIDQEMANTDYQLSGDGKKLMIWENLDVLLNENNIEVKYNEMKKEIEFKGIEHTQQLADATFTRMNSLCLKSQFPTTSSKTREFAQVVAAKNMYNPIADYLDICKDEFYESKGELDKLLDTMKFSVQCPERIKFYRKMVTKWLINCVHMAYNTIDLERTAEFIITFQGRQGLGKSKWLRSIVPKGFFGSDIILDLDNKDKVIEVLKYWIVELGELGGTFKKSDRDKLKAFITSMRDTYRNPYGIDSCTHPRRTVFAATVNDTEFLVDKTGNRRFAVLPVESLDYEHDVNIDAMWGEVIKLRDDYIKNDIPIFMTIEEQKINDEYNSQFVAKTDTQIALEEIFNFDDADPSNDSDFGAVTISMINKYMVDTNKKNYGENAIKRTLNEMGYELMNEGKPIYAGKDKDRKRGRYYKLPYVAGLSLPF